MSFIRAIIRFCIDWSGALYFYRVPILMAAALILLWLFDSSSMVSGLFAASTWSSLGLAFALTMVASEIYVLMTLLQLHGPARLKMNLPSALDHGNHWPRVLVSVLPPVLILVELGRLNPSTWLYLLGGVAIGIVPCVVIHNLNRVPNRIRQSTQIVRLTKTREL